MAEIRKSVLIEHTAQEMYALVAAVEDYPAFLPWCGGGEILSQEGNEVRARLHIKYHGIKTSFSTVNENEPGRRIRMRLKEGPFRRLDGEWVFTPLGDAACKIEFSLAYDFSSGMLEKALGPVFNHIANSFVEAFILRADQLAAKAAGASEK